MSIVTPIRTGDRSPCSQGGDRGMDAPLGRLLVAVAMGAVGAAAATTIAGATLARIPASPASMALPGWSLRQIGGLPAAIERRYLVHTVGWQWLR